MAGRLDGKVAVITGAASGIGEATARLFAAEGAKLVIADRQVDTGEALARELGDAVFVQTDVTVEDQVAAAVDRAVAHFGRLDCMVNNAGIVGVTGSIARIEADAWRSTLGVLLDGVFFGMKHAARVMAPQGGGSILSTASIAALTGGFGQHAYTAAKHAVVGLTKSVAAELAASNIRVNAVAPGGVPTPLTADLRGGDMEKARQGSAQASALGRIIDGRDIGAAFVFLASEDARNITGQVIVVDGGRTAFATPAPGQFPDDPGYLDVSRGVR